MAVLLDTGKVCRGGPSGSRLNDEKEHTGICDA